MKSVKAISFQVVRAVNPARTRKSFSSGNSMLILVELQLIKDVELAFEK
jgi:hypothetical protein